MIRHIAAVWFAAALIALLFFGLPPLFNGGTLANLAGAFVVLVLLSAVVAVLNYRRGKSK